MSFKENRMLRKEQRKLNKLSKKTAKLKEEINDMVEPEHTVLDTQTSDTSSNKVAQPQKVVCVETGEVYDSIKKASEATGISASSISRSCKEGKATKGYTFVKVE